MIRLSPRTEALAHRLAVARGVSVEEAVKQAIEASARSAGVETGTQLSRDRSPHAVAARKARFQRIADEIAAMPLLDPRSPRAIMDDLDPL